MSTYNDFQMYRKLSKFGVSLFDILKKDLSSKNFSYEDLCNLDLRGYNLSNTYLIETNLEGTLFDKNTILFRANITGVKKSNLGNANYNGAIIYLPFFEFE